MWTMNTILVALLVICLSLRFGSADHTQNSHKHNADGSTGNVVIDTGFPGSQSGRATGADGSQGAGATGRGTGTARGQGTAGIGGTFGPATGPRRVGINVGGIGQDTASGLGANTLGAAIGLGQAGVIGSGFAPVGQPGVIGSGFAPGARGGAFGSGQGTTRVLEAPITPTVTKTRTIDHFVTYTDLAYHSIPVTLTDLVVRTTTITTNQVVRTPVDDRVAVQTTVVIRPTSLTVTCSKYYYNIVTEVSVDYVTITHSSYIIKQVTYTTTATQLQAYTSTMIRTNIRTQRTTVTDYRTITDTIYNNAGYYH